jgi:hypothetical protein
VGIRPPIAPHFSTKDLVVLAAKPELARMIGKLVAKPVKYRIDDSGVEEALAARNLRCSLLESTPAQMRFGNDHS